MTMAIGTSMHLASTLQQLYTSSLPRGWISEFVDSMELVSEREKASVFHQLSSVSRMSVQVFQGMYFAGLETQGESTAIKYMKTMINSGLARLQDIFTLS